MPAGNVSLRAVEARAGYLLAGEYRRVRRPALELREVRDGPVNEGFLGNLRGGEHAVGHHLVELGARRDVALGDDDLDHVAAGPRVLLDSAYVQKHRERRGSSQRAAYLGSLP